MPAFGFSQGPELLLLVCLFYLTVEILVLDLMN